MRVKALPLFSVLPFIINFILILFPASTFPATIHVPNAAHPTIQSGIDAAVGGDTVLVADGTYSGNGNKNLDFKGKAITVISENGPYATIIDCEGEGHGFNFHSGEGQGSVVSGFTLINARDIYKRAGIYIYNASPVIRNNVIRNNQEWGIRIESYSNPLIMGNIINDNAGGIQIPGGQPTITGNEIKNNAGNGIETYNTRTFTLLNSIIVGNGKNGVKFLIPSGSSSGSVVIANNTVVANADNGISGNRDPVITISNNIVTNNGDCGVYFETNYDWGLPNSNYNNVWQNAGGNYCELANPGANDISADPLFFDSADGDYHLWPNSPCIDAGTSASAPGTDIDGDSRPIDGNADGSAEYDIGADEAGVRLNHDIAVQTRLPRPVPIKFGTNFTPEAEIINLGLQAENDFTVTCEIRQNSTIIYSDTKNLPQLESLDWADVVFTGWTPQDEGEYELKIYTQLAADQNKENDTAIRTIEVIVFSAQFTSDVMQGLVPLDVNFSDLSTGDFTEWLWDFGDGNQSSAQNPTHTYNSNGIYTVSLTISNGTLNDTQAKIEYIKVSREDPDIFGIELGNRWSYQGTNSGVAVTSGAEVISIDQTTFPVTTHVIEVKENGSFYSKDWYETTPSELKSWGFDDGDFYGFSSGLLLSWYPMKVKDRKYSSATVPIEGLVFNISMTVEALSTEFINLGFDTLEAFKLRYVIRIWGHGYDQSDTSYSWVVPYLGTVKEQDDDGTEILTDFAIGNGTITPTTDFDKDGLKDSEELIIYETNWQESDTDQDAMPDGWEVTYGLDPKSNDASEDSDGDGVSNITEYQRRTHPNDSGSYPSIAMPWIPLLLDD